MLGELHFTPVRERLHTELFPYRLGGEAKWELQSKVSRMRLK
jgi:hypothetical protein